MIRCVLLLSGCSASADSSTWVCLLPAASLVEDNETMRALLSPLIKDTLIPPVLRAVCLNDSTHSTGIVCVCLVLSFLWCANVRLLHCEYFLCVMMGGFFYPQTCAHRCSWTCLTRELELYLLLMPMCLSDDAVMFRAAYRTSVLFLILTKMCLKHQPSKTLKNQKLVLNVRSICIFVDLLFDQVVSVVACRFSHSLLTFHVSGHQYIKHSNDPHL